MTNFTNDGRRLQAVEAGTAYLSPDGRLVNVASNMGVLFSDDFGGSSLDTAARWDVYDGGLGTVTQSTGAQGAIGSGVTGITDSVAASALTISMGTTNGAERWYLSKAIFAGAEDITVILSRSQALAANSFFVGLVEVDLATGYPILNPNLAGDFTNRGGVEFGQTTGSTTARLEAVGDSSSAAATVSNSSFAPANMTTVFETLIEYHAEDIVASTCAVDSIAGKTATATRLSTQAPHDGRAYKLLIRARNVSGPGSNTNFVVQRILVVDCQEQRVELTSGRGDQAPNKAVAVNLANNQTDNVALAASMVGAGGIVLSTAGGPSAATSGRFGALFLDLARRLVVKPLGNTPSHTAGSVALSTSASTNTAVIAAPGAGLKVDVQSVVISNRDSVAHTVDIKDNATVVCSAIVAAGASLVIPFPAGLPSAAANTAWNGSVRETSTTAVEVSMSGYKTTG